MTTDQTAPSAWALPVWTPPAWTRYVVDFGRPAKPAPCPECGDTPHPMDDCQTRTGWFAVRGGSRLCDDCTAQLIPSPIIEVLDHLEGIDTELWHAANPGGGMRWDGPTRDPGSEDRLAARVMIVALCEHYLAAFKQRYDLDIKQVSG